MRSKDAFQALDDMARMGLMPASDDSGDQTRVYESLPGLTPEERVVPPGYVSLQAILDEASVLEAEEAKFAAVEFVSETDDPREAATMAAVREARLPDRLFLPGNKVQHVNMQEGVPYAF